MVEGALVCSRRCLLTVSRSQKCGQELQQVLHRLCCLVDKLSVQVVVCTNSLHGLYAFESVTLCFDKWACNVK